MAYRSVYLRSVSVCDCGHECLIRVPRVSQGDGKERIRTIPRRLFTRLLVLMRSCTNTKLSGFDVGWDVIQHDNMHVAIIAPIGLT